MELDDLKRTWEQHDRKLDASIRLNQRLVRDSILGKASTVLGRLSRWLWLELVLTGIAALWLGSFLWDNRTEPLLFATALGLHLGVVGLIGACVRQLVLLSEIDHGAPIATIQRRLEELRVERIRVSKWSLLLGPLVWLPVLIVLVRSATGLDMYTHFSTAWIAANIALGVMVAVAGSWASRRYADRLNRSSLFGQLARDLAGHNLNAATAYLESLSELTEQDEAA